MEYIITFKNTNFAVKAEQFLLEQKLRVSVLPLPSQIHAGCGICLSVVPDIIKTALKILNDKGIGESSLFSRELQGNQYVYTEIGLTEKRKNPIIPRN